MNILIFGSNGFIGNYLSEHFKVSGHNVFTIGKSNINNISIDLSKHYTSINGEYDYVIHCSGLVHSDKHSSEVDNSLLINDVNITINLLKSLSNTIFKKFIYLSSVAVYGLDIGNNISVNTEINPTSGYAISKIISENMIKNSFSENQLLILRLPLVNGPNPKGNIKKLIDRINSNLMIVFRNNQSKKSILELSDLFYFILNDSSGLTGTHLIKSYDINFNLFVETIALQNNKKLIYLPLIILKLLVFLSKIFLSKNINKLLLKINNNLTFESSLTSNKNEF